MSVAHWKVIEEGWKEECLRHVLLEHCTVADKALRSSVAGTVRINCGGPDFVDVAGNLWQADAYFQGGVARVANSSVVSVVASKGYSSIPLYATYREWQTEQIGTYVVPLPAGPGLYWVSPARNQAYVCAMLRLCTAVGPNSYQVVTKVMLCLVN